MSNQVSLQNKLYLQNGSSKAANGQFNENTSFSEIIAESGENKFLSYPYNNNNNNRLAGQTKDETNIESSHNLMQKPNQQQQGIKLPLYNFQNDQLPSFAQNYQQQQQFLQAMPAQYNSTIRIHYKSLLSLSQESVKSEKDNQKQDNSNNQSLNSFQQYIDKQNQLTRSQNLMKELKLKPAQYELYKNLKEMKVKSEIAFFILVSENCMSMEEALSFLTTDEDNQYLHFFLPRSSDNDTICEICICDKRMHVKSSYENIKFALGIRKQIRELSQQDCLENADIKQMLLSQSDRGININLSNQQVLQVNSFYPQISPRSPPLRKRTLTCQICYNQVDESSMLFFNNQNHEICIECFRTYLSEEIMISKIENLKCPHCSCTLSEQTIFDHTTASLYKKYKIFLRNTLINKDPLKRFCPTPNCDQIISLKDKNQKNAKCETCQIVICCQCNRIEHQGISCEDLLEKEIEDLTDSRDIQRCNKCKSLVQKVQGCNHMTCSICQYQWCWLCGNTYTKIHMMPLNPFGCPFLQSERFTVKNMQMWKIYLIRFFTLIAVIILLPFAILFSGPVLALYGYLEILNHTIVFNTNSKLKKLFFILGGFLAFILGFLLDPLILICIIPLGIYVLYIQINEKNRIETISNLRLRELQQRNESVNNNEFANYNLQL
ncbi:hypothetical protein ABPG74_015513 [Tetrahymena malaccensis]